MELMPDELRAKFPQLYANEGREPKDIKVIAKYFDPTSAWTWYATEFDGNDTFFGYVVGFERELGYFSLMELQSARCRFGLKIERDLYFKEDATLEEVMSGDVT